MEPSAATQRGTPRAIDRLGIEQVINASGIYTDLGGSVLSPSVWEAVTQVNTTWVSMPQLLERSGEIIAELAGAEAARVTPGASAGLALAVGACIAGSDHDLIESLPDAKGAPHGMVLQVGHRYKYTRCGLLSGAELVEIGDESGTTGEQLETALDGGVVAVLHPIHLEGKAGTLTLEEVVAIAKPRGVRVIVDAAYMSYPTDLIGTYVGRGADAEVFSAKYFWGPNGGGFIAGSRELLEAVAALDFTKFESGPHLAYGRAFKMDRSQVLATVLALQEWMEMDHAARWASYETRADAIEAALGGVDAELSSCCFTLDERIIEEPVNSVLIAPREGAAGVADIDARMQAGSPPIMGIPMPEGYALCLETIEPEDDGLIVDRVREALAG